MSQTKILTSRRSLIIALLRFALLVTIASLAPLIRNQLITGSLVNATLFLATIFLGAQGAVAVGILPSFISLAIGFLPFLLFPMVPFIVSGNTILILVFNRFRKNSYWQGVILSSLSKFSFLYFFSSVLIKIIIRKEVALKISTMMSWPQLITALMGGLIAFCFLRLIKKGDDGP